jgi:hypothetical protein
MENPEWV